MEFQDYYQTLGVARDAKPDAIKAAYRRLARKYHPDVSKESDAEERFKALGEAYEVLRDPDKRAAYDQLGANWKAGQDFRPPPGWGGFDSGGSRPGGARGGGAPDAFSDFFRELFGGLGPQGQRPRGARGRPRPQPAPAAAHRIDITLEEAFAGSQRQLRLTESGPRQGGGARTLNVRIPSGVTDGQRIRLNGQGPVGADGQRSDLFLEVKLLAHTRFTVEGNNVLLELPLAPWEAALGATVEVPTLGGKVDLRIPAGAKAGAKLRLRGRGLGKEPQGDQLCAVSIVVPDADTAKARAAYEAFAEAFEFAPRAAWG